jgi:predicted RNA-binding protein YlqC (UPF0109 family)
MKELIQDIVMALVDDPSQVRVDEKEEVLKEKNGGSEVKGIIYEIRVGKGEAGKVIGKEGRIANGIRAIIKGIAGKKHLKANIDIVNDEGGR